MKHNTPQKSSVEKALEILMSFYPHNHGMGTVELSKNLDLHPATVNRILKILSRKTFLQQNHRTRKFSLGQSVFQLGRTMIQSISENLLDIALPHIRELSERVEYTIVLEVMSGSNPVVAYIAEGKRGITIRPQIGNNVPIHASAGAKAMIAFLEPKKLDGILDGKLQPINQNTITDLKILNRELKRIRHQGVAFCREEMELGVNAISAPIFDYENNPIAAILVIGLAPRLKCDIESPVVVPLKKAASDISSQLFMMKRGG